MKVVFCDACEEQLSTQESELPFWFYNASRMLAMGGECAPGTERKNYKIDLCFKCKVRMETVALIELEKIKKGE